MKYVYALLVVLTLAVVALTLDPSLISVGDTNLALVYPVSQMIAMRGVVAAVLAVFAAIIIVLALVRFFMFRRGVLPAILGVGILAVSAGHLLILNDRGLDSSDSLPPDYGVTHVSEGNGDVTVLSYNTLGGQTTMEDLVPLIVANGVDIAVLPETSTENAELLAAELRSQGLSFTVFSSGADKYNPEIESTAVLVATSLGEYRQGPDLGLTWGSVNLRSVSGGPDIVAVHPVAPVQNLSAVWQEEITTVYSHCSTMSNTIMAGDFNSTVDHMHATGASCESSLDGFVGGYGTWPAAVPGIIGSPIDNVFSDWTTRHAAIVQVGDSDHRGVLVRLRQ